MSLDNTTGRVTFLEDGIYAAWLNTQWATAAATLKLARISWVVNQEQIIADFQQIESEADPVAGVDTVSVSGVCFVNITGGTNYIQGMVRQSSGGSRVLDWADLSVVQLAAITYP